MSNEKFEQTKEKKEIGKEEKKFKQSDNKKFMQSEKKTKLTFKENRAFELHVNRKIFKFEGRESKIFDSNLLNHKDFTDKIKKKFIIQEVM
jgi:hypothetical protein